MIKIKEVIVVEGKDDVNAVKRAVDAEVICTSGMGINEQILKQIEEASDRCGIIILTDPDYPGEKIRSIISNRVKECKHAYLSQKQAKCKKTGKIGVEFAKPEIIREALLKARAEKSTNINKYTIQDLYNWGLMGSSFGGKKRSKLSEVLGIGKTNAKQFLKRINAYNISRAEIEEALFKIEGFENL